jgi:alpha-tubulin suppressor-like RCC1 family protein
MNLYAAGYNAAYDLGLGDNTLRDEFTQVAGDWLVIASSNGFLKCAAGIKANGTLWGVGDNSQRQLGGLASASYHTLTQIGSATDWADVAFGYDTMFAIKTDGTLWTCGDNGVYQCGLGHNTSPVTSLTQIGSATNWVSVKACENAAYAINSSGSLYAWGVNDVGQTGAGAGSYYSTPQAVSLGSNCVELVAGTYHAVARLASGALKSWGYNNVGQLGLGDTTDRNTPVQIGSGTTWAKLAVGGSNSYAIKADGTAWAWGAGQYYATAQGSTSNQTSPVQIGSATDWDHAASGGGWLLLKKTSGAVYVVGRNNTGVLGNNSTTDVTSLTALTSYGITLPAGTLTLRGFPLASFILSTTPPEYVVIPTSVTVSYPVGTVSIPTKLSVTETGTLTIPTQLAVIAAGDAPLWTARCIINGVDVSASMEESASVTAEEGAARIASVVINPPSGTVAPLDYVGKSITLDYVPVIGGTSVPLRLFTGVIDTPNYDPDTRLLRLECVDDLQNRVAVLDRAVIAALIGGRYTEAVQGVLADNWDYAKALLTTVSASLDVGPSGGLRVTPCQIATSWATYDSTALLYQRSAVTYPQRSTLVNSVAVEFDYRYPRLRQRFTTLGWSGTHIDMAPCGWQYPKQQDIEGAANGSGWKVTLGIYYPAPAAIPHSSGGFIHPDDGAIDMAIIYLTQRHSQTVTEKYALTVAATESVTANGTLPGSVRGALASAFDGLAWESALDVAPLMPDGGEQDYSPDATRTDADYALQTLLDQANVKILGSHRGARVSNAVLCNPALDLDKRVTISTADMSASGKVAAVTHTLDFASGSAISEFSIACFGAGGAGIITPDTLDPPAAPAAAAATHDWAAETPSLFVQTYGVTAYSDSLMGLLLNPPETIFVEDVPDIGSKSYPNPYYVAGSYPVTGFRVQMPGVDDADRNPLDKPVAGSYAILIPSDTLTFTVP